MAKARIHVTKTAKTVKIAKNRNKQGGNHKRSMLSEEEKKILWMHYKEKKTLQCIADEIGLSEIAVKKKHRKMLMKIGRMI